MRESAYNSFGGGQLDSAGDGHRTGTSASLIKSRGV